ncbi:hypothetical protein [Rhodovulum marinum]|uniref:Uncharacterized protein n=1 Tax=Rhodovulum marinum TaxID=320662 RepID=A0A4V2SRW1_9RHOB|nr:hypothetical protein [Rhodovulum marinum]TCP44386.1 hypothetical protein EV662_101479 [Rhodovulum marinum]
MQMALCAVLQDQLSDRIAEMEEVMHGVDADSATALEDNLATARRLMEVVTERNAESAGTRTDFKTAREAALARVRAAEG